MENNEKLRCKASGEAFLDAPPGALVTYAAYVVWPPGNTPPFSTISNCT